MVQDAIARLEYDLYYIKNMSTSLDTFILLHTVKAVVLARGAD
jgi:lipopolysaccharide/colanic/teichoic acid biosynthesis glycosyltransferase